MSGTKAGAIQSIGVPLFPFAQVSSLAAPLRISRSLALVIAT